METKKRYVKTVFALLLVMMSLQGFAAGPLPEAQQRRFDYFYLEAVRLRNLGRYAEAYELYRHALTINPNAPEALFDMASYCNYLGTKEEAVRYYERAVQLAPDNVWYKQMLGNFYRQNKQLDKSALVFEELAKNTPEKVEVYYELVDIYSNQQDYQKEIWALNQIEQLEGKSEQLSMEKFRIYLQLEEKKKAFAEMEDLAKNYPNDTRYRVILGDLYLDNDQPVKALELYQQVLAEEPNNVLAQLSLSTYYEKTNHDAMSQHTLENLLVNPSVDDGSRVEIMRRIIVKSEMAQQDSLYVLAQFDKVLAMPQESANMAILCTQYMLHKKMPMQQVIPALRKVVQLDPGNEAARLQLMQYAFNQENFAEVISICQEAIEYAPENLPFYYYQGMAYYQSDQEIKALGAFQKGIEQVVADSSPELVSNMYGAMGDIYYSQKNSGKAYEAYDSALVYKQDNILVLNNYAYYLSLEHRDLDKAEEMSYRTVKANPQSSNELDTYAWILFIKGKLTEARIYIDESLKNGGAESAGIVEHAGDIYFKNGETEKAMEFWRKADEMGCDSKTLKDKIKLKKYIEE